MRKLGLVSMFCALAIAVASCSNGNGGGNGGSGGNDGKKEGVKKCRRCTAQTEQVGRAR